MMNLVDLQDKIKGLSEQQLIQEMQMPSGQMPQFLVLSEITRRQKMRDAFAMEQGRDQSTVAQDAVAAAGVPGEFAGEMAGAMAPQTDMGANTGAMAQQGALPPEPQPVMGMAGGGIVALQAGGRVSGSGQVVVEGGRQFFVTRDGRRIPLGAQLPANLQSMLDVPETEIPEVVEPAAPITATPSPSPNLYDFLPAPLGAPSGYDFGPSPLSPLERIGGALPPGPQPGVEMEATLLDPMGERRRQIAEAAERRAAAMSIPPGVEMEAGLLDPEAGATGFETPAWLKDAVSRAEEAAKGLAGRFGLEYDRGSMRLPETPDAETETPDAETPTPTPPARPVGGGIAGLGGAPGAPGAPGATSPFEQEILNMLDAREKRAEQDKWLALAQFGLQLMSSKEPTLGGAIGAAGAPALETLRSGREGSEADRLNLLSTLEGHRMGQAKLELERQALAARAAGKAVDPLAFGMTAQEKNLIEYLEGLVTSPDPSAQLAAKTQLDELRARIAARSALTSGGGRVPLN
jgi:hypothetical protein